MGPLHGVEKRGYVYRVKKVRIYVQIQLQIHSSSRRVLSNRPYILRIKAWPRILRDFLHGFTVPREQPDRSFDMYLQVDTWRCRPVVNHWWYMWRCVWSGTAHQRHNSTWFTRVFFFHAAHDRVSRVRNTNVPALVSENMWYHHIMFELLSVLLLLQPHIHFSSCSSLYILQNSREEFTLVRGVHSISLHKKKIQPKRKSPVLRSKYYHKYYRRLIGSKNTLGNWTPK